MKILDIFRKKKEILPHEYSFEGKVLDPNHLFFDCQNPELQRTNTLSVNGIAHATTSSSPLIPNEFPNLYYLPYPLDSLLSGYNRVNAKNTYYHIKFDFKVGEGFTKDITTLYFTKLCGEYTIYLNGEKILNDKNKLFVNANVSKLINVGDNTLILTFKEDKHEKIIGPSGPIYLKSTPKNYIKSVSIKSDIKNEQVIFDIDAPNPSGLISITTPTAMHREYNFKGNKVEIKLDNLILWTPDKPFFYQYSINIDEGGDSVRGIFALLEYGIDNIDGVNAITINNNPTPIKGILDNYYYSDSLSLPPTVNHIKTLFSEIKALGFNSIRKTNFVDIKDYYYNGLLKGLLIMQDVTFNGIDDLDNKIDYLKNFQALYLLNIILTDNKVNHKELYNYVKSKMPNKLISISLKGNKSYGDVSIKQNEFIGYSDFKKTPEEPFIANIKFENRVDGLKEFMDTKYIPSTMMGMVGFYYSSLNHIDDGLYNSSITKIRVKKSTVNDILK